MTDQTLEAWLADLQRRAAAGAEALDRVRPGWAGSINTSCLQMEEPAHCILGQLFGGYDHGLDVLLDALGEDVDDPEEMSPRLGFTLSMFETKPFLDAHPGYVDDLWDTLDDAWRYQVQRRRGEA